MIQLIVADRNLAMGVHALCEYCRLFGGTLATRLVSEEDVEMIWECPVSVETELTRIDFNGLTHTTYLAPGDTVRCSWKLCFGLTERLSPERQQRFAR